MHARMDRHEASLRCKRLITQFLHFLLPFLARQYLGPDWMRHLSQYCMRLPIIQSHFALACMANFMVVLCLVQTPHIVMMLIDRFTYWIIMVARLVKEDFIINNRR